jgi:tetratricopeptide (TPR) repeat protein
MKKTKIIIKIFYIDLILVLFATCTFCGATPAAEANFKEAVSAIASNDLAKGLHYMELALADDPDNLQYASEYRQAAIRNKEFDRSLNFFEKMIADHPKSANLHLNNGFAYVDKIPVAGSITQVIYANDALQEFTKAVELQPGWLAYYTRGNSYLFWPKIFNKASLGVSDLEQALKLQQAGPKRAYYVRVYIALGDGYCKTDELEKARNIWQEGLRQFPDNKILKERLVLQGDQLRSAIENGFDPNKRVNTDLREIWTDRSK